MSHRHKWQFERASFGGVVGNDLTGLHEIFLFVCICGERKKVKAK